MVDVEKYENGMGRVEMELEERYRITFVYFMQIVKHDRK